MCPRNATVDFMHSGNIPLPTPDALMVVLLEQQKLLGKKDKTLDKQSAEIKKQQAWIKVLEEKLRLEEHRLFGASSEKNLFQENWIADEAEVLADGEPDPDDGEAATDDDTENDPEKKPKKPRARNDFSPDLPRTQRYICPSDEDVKAQLTPSSSRSRKSSISSRPKSGHRDHAGEGSLPGR